MLTDELVELMEKKHSINSKNLFLFIYPNTLINTRQFIKVLPKLRTFVSKKIILFSFLKYRLKFTYLKVDSILIFITSSGIRFLDRDNNLQVFYFKNKHSRDIRRFKKNYYLKKHYNQFINCPKVGEIIVEKNYVHYVEEFLDYRRFAFRDFIWNSRSIQQQLKEISKNSPNTYKSFIKRSDGLWTSLQHFDIQKKNLLIKHNRAYILDFDRARYNIILYDQIHLIVTSLLRFTKLKLLFLGPIIVKKVYMNLLELYYNDNLFKQVNLKENLMNYWSAYIIEVTESYGKKSNKVELINKSFPLIKSHFEKALKKLN